MIQIPDPCHEDWSKMKIVRDGRHCLTCTKTVVDFTKMERYEIIEYLLLNKDKSVCGHINKSMLDFDVEELYITVQRAETIKRNSNLAFCILSMGALFLASCSNESATKDDSDYKVRGLVMNVEAPKYEKTESTEKTNSKNENKSMNKIGFVAPHITEFPSDDTIPEIKKVDETVDGGIGFYIDEEPPQAEFPGGIVALRKYLTENLKIPKSVKESGKVYVKFTVRKDGSIGYVQFLKNYSEDENLKNEITRVLQSMPKWIPGKVNGENVITDFTLPIIIDLDK